MIYINQLLHSSIFNVKISVRLNGEMCETELKGGMQNQQVGSWKRINILCER